MARSFKMPDLGEGIHEGEVLNIFVSEGDTVNEEDPLLEVETDKAAVEIPSPFSGRVEKVLVKTGDIVKVGDVLVTFDAVEHKSDEKKTEHHDEDQKPVPKSGKADDTGRKPAKKMTSDDSDRPVPASPATRRLARELSVDLHEVPASGPEGLVTARDVRNFADKKAAQPEEKNRDKPAETGEVKVRANSENDMARNARPIDISIPPMPDFSKWGPVEKVPVRSIRKATARQMSISWSVVPHVSNQDLADISHLEAFRQKNKKKVHQQEGRLTLTVFALKAAATALKAFPFFNASFDTDAGEIILKKYYHIGVAVNTDLGLVVPVIRDVDRKSITELAIELHGIAQRARDRKITPKEMHGGTFTITNAGPMGGGHFSPIINYPEVAILGLGQARMTPVVKTDPDGNHEIVPRLMMPIVLCFDHRVQDGVDAIGFTRMIINALEDPDKLFMTMV